MRIPRTLLLAIGFLCACANGTDPLSKFEPVEAVTVVDAPSPGDSSRYNTDDVNHGRYLVQLLGCGACHTDGALIGEPNPRRLLAGSRIGLAHSNPLVTNRPGVVFAPNLTPDPDTGIGNVSDLAVADSIKGGANRHRIGPLKVMPITALAMLKDSDVHAIVAYLRSLDAVSHAVPGRVIEGQRTNEQFVHFGVYRSREN